MNNRIVGQGQKPASQFKVNPNAWRMHPKEQREALQALLLQVGWVAQVIENVRTGHLIDGQERVGIALQNNDEEVPYLKVDLSLEEERLILATLDPIGAMAEADREKLDILLAEISTDDDMIRDLLKDIARRELESYCKSSTLEDAGAEVDHAAELQKKWQVKPEDLWALGDHRVLCGDSTCRQDVERLFAGEQYQAVVTSPLYFIDRSFENTFTPETGKALIADVARLWFDFCKEGGYFFDNFSGIQTFEMAEAWAGIDHCEYPAALFHYPCFREAGWRLHAERIWYKPHSKCRGLWVLSTNRPVFSWEYLWTWRKGTGQEILGDSNLRVRGVWDAADSKEDFKLKELGHDGSFALYLPEWAIRVHSQKGDLIGEPFLGTGTTLIAAERTCRICYGMEIDPKWVAVTLERYENSTGKNPVRIDV